MDLEAKIRQLQQVIQKHKAGDEEAIQKIAKLQVNTEFMTLRGWSFFTQQ